MTYEYFTKDLHLGVESIIGTLLILFMILVYTRIFGLKSFSKMNGSDFIHTLIIGNIAGMSLATGKPGLVMGVFILGLLFTLNYVINVIRAKYNTAENIMSNAPVMLMRDGEFIDKNMAKCNVSKDEIRGKLREANVLRLSQIHAVILEATGDVSVLHEEDECNEIDDFILEGVIT